MSGRGPLDAADLSLLLDAVRYQARRVRDPAESVRLTGLVDRLEDLLLAPSSQERMLRLSPPEQDVLRRHVESYCTQLTGRGASALGREEARRLRQILDELSDDPALLRWWRALFRRRGSRSQGVRHPR